MRVAYCSDIHWEFAPLLLSELKPCEADVMILAGDVYPEKYIHSDSNFRKFCEDLSGTYKDIIIISGNHEFYRGDWYKSLEKLREFYQDFPNIHFLEDNYIDIQGVRFIGSALWGDLKRKDPIVMMIGESFMNEYRLCRNSHWGYRKLTSQDTVRRFDGSFRFIQDHLTENTVIITHHAPSLQSVHEKYKNEGEINYSFASDLDKFILDNPGIKYWIHGHTHNKFNYLIGSTRILCNPRGYARHEALALTFEFEVFEI